MREAGFKDIRRFHNNRKRLYSNAPGDTAAQLAEPLVYRLLAPFWTQIWLRRAPASPGRPEGAGPDCRHMLMRDDPHDASVSGGEAEPLLGHVQRAVRPGRHPGREDEAGDDRLVGPVLADAHDRAGTGRRPAGGRARLERVQLPAREREPEHLLETCRPQTEVVAVQAPDTLVRGAAVLGPEDAEVGDVERRLPLSVVRPGVAVLALASLCPAEAIAVGTTCPTTAEMSSTRLIEPEVETRSSSPWFESIG